MLSSSIGSVTSYIDDLKTASDRDAARKLWERYFQQILQFARKKFPNFPRQAQDEEDVVLHVFDSFFRDLEEGRLPGLDNREALWRLLIVKTSQRALDYIRREQAQKRQPVAAPSSRAEPAADEMADAADRLDALLRSLGDDPQGRTLQQIAVWRMENYTNREIAEKLNISEKTVERKLDLIRKAWEEELAEELGN
jgi:RNA polymerase sigma factor (sigma-70 family)